MKKFLIVSALLVLALAAPLLFLPAPGNRPAAPAEGLPWQIDVLAEGNSRVFGLTLGAATLADARARFGPDLQVAVVAAPQEQGALEAYLDNVTLGFVTGKLVVTMDASAETVAAMRARAVKTEYMESTTRKSTLAPADLEAAERLPIAALAFVPSANLDEQMILQRFGTPAERIRSAETVEHFLYPDRGLDVVLDAKRKELLQYVAPKRFARLRDPLLAAKPAS